MQILYILFLQVGNVSLNSVKDTLFITTYEAGTYKIKGLAYRSNAVYDISPEYTITSAGVLSVNDKAMRLIKKFIKIIRILLTLQQTSQLKSIQRFNFQ